jgi:HlyD family secretion protein
MASFFHRKSTYFIGLLALGILFFSINLFKREGSDQSVASTIAQKRNFAVVVRMVGELDAANPLVISSGIKGERGKIIHIIEEGTRVQKGDVLARFDPTPFEDEVAKLKMKLVEAEAAVKANQQNLSWEKTEAEKEDKAAQFDLNFTELDHVKIEKGEGPQEMARLFRDFIKAQREYETKKAYLQDLQPLIDRRIVDASEMIQAKRLVEEAEGAYETAKKQYESYRQFVLPAQIEKAKSVKARARMVMDQVKKGGVFKVAKAQEAYQKSMAELNVLRSTLQQVEEELTRSIIRAPQEGMVVLSEAFFEGEKRKPRIGDRIWQNQPLMYLPDLSKMIVRSQVREDDLHKIAVGKPVEIKVDAYPDIRLVGRVEQLGVMAKAKEEVRRGPKYFQVVISVGGKNENLRPGMTARVDIHCFSVSGALTVPVHAVFFEGKKACCYVSSSATFEKREVVVGAQNEDWVEIIKGLTTGEKVALSKPANDFVTVKKNTTP